MHNDLANLSARLSELRKDCREHFGGINWKPVTKTFGIYSVNIMENADFIRYCEHHFVEIEKLLSALSSIEYSAVEVNK
jgi:hypothetical protein